MDTPRPSTSASRSPDEIHDRARSPRPALSPALAATLTFLAAAAVLVLEIAAGRLLAPYVGVSLETYTGIIGVILGGIALGAWAGGRLADRVGPVALLGPTLVAGGLSAIASVPIVSVVGSLRLGSDVTAIVVLATTGFVVPSTILSAVAPMIVRATIVDLATSGSLVGRLSAIATLGAISGTFLTGFVLLGLVPTSWLIVGVGALLAVLGVLVAWYLGRSRSAVVIGLAGILLVGGTALAAGSPCDRESAYYCIAVVADERDADGRTLHLDDLRHAYVDLADPNVLRFAYVRWFAAASLAPIAARNGAVDALHLGGGGFSFPRYLVAAYPASRHTVLELDSEILDVARAELGFEPSDRIRVEVGDARLSIARQPTDGFDLVVGDAFGGRSVPWHLTTRELLAEVDRVLRPDGRYIMNLIDGRELRFARAEVTTLRSLFPHVAVIVDAAALSGVSGTNVVLIASHAPLETSEIAERVGADRAGVRVLSSPTELDGFAGRAPILTDDFAPVDQLISR